MQFVNEGHKMAVCYKSPKEGEILFNRGNNNVREETPSELTQNRWDLHNVKQAEGFP